jgi:glycine cleavage system H protein
MMSDIPSDLKYTAEHEWLRSNGDGTVTIGITDHAQDQLGDLVYVEVPSVGQTVAAGDDCAVVESVKAASDVYSPVDGEVVEINEALADSPELVNQEPYGEGWLFCVKTSDNLDSFLDAAAYAEVVAEEKNDDDDDDD